jgi:hypothetical protein
MKKVRVTREELIRLSRVTSLTEETMQKGYLNKKELKLFNAACRFVIKGDTHGLS